MTISVNSASCTEGVLPKGLFFFLTLAAILFYSPIIVGGYPGDGTSEDFGDALRQIGFSSLFLLVVLTLVSTKGAAELLKVPAALALLMLWCWLSIAWAIDPASSFRRVAFMSAVILSIVYLVNMLDDRTIMSIFGLSFVAILLVDWAVIPIVPQAVHPPGDIEFEAVGGAWRGIHVHRNTAGAFSALAALYFLQQLIFRNRFRALAAVFLVLSLGFLFLTGSKTSNGVVCIAAAGGLLFHCGYRHPLLRTALLIWVLGLAFIAVVEFEDLLPAMLAFLEDPTALTGRTQIWEMLVGYAEDHLLLGSGYGSFWAIGNASPVYALGKAWLSTVTQSHNGYLDLLAQTGLIGVVIAAIGLIVHPIYILFTHRLQPPHMRWFLGAFFIFVWLHNVTETSLLDRANFLWVATVSAYCVLIRQSKSKS